MNRKGQMIPQRFMKLLKEMAEPDLWEYENGDTMEHDAQATLHAFAELRRGSKAATIELGKVNMNNTATALSHLALQERVGRVLALIDIHGGIEENKTWVIDQVVRELCVTDTKYREWVKNHQQDEPESYFWETGIAP